MCCNRFVTGSNFLLCPAALPTSGGTLPPNAREEGPRSPLGAALIDEVAAAIEAEPDVELLAIDGPHRLSHDLEVGASEVVGDVAVLLGGGDLGVPALRLESGDRPASAEEQPGIEVPEVVVPDLLPSTSCTTFRQ
jgi:hypothetical protein